MGVQVLGILRFLSPTLSEILSQLPFSIFSTLQEIRLRSTRPLQLITEKEEIFISEGGERVQPSQAYQVTARDMEETLQLMSKGSLYMLEEELRQGYLTLEGGFRVGFSGRGVLEQGEISTIRDISSFNIRIAREVIGAASGIIKYLIVPPTSVFSTLIISPPGAGKTTLLRDIARFLSDGAAEYRFSGVKVGVVDERSELGGAYKGIPQNNIGIRTDLFDAVPKSQGMQRMIRSLSPQVLVTDELGGEEDLKALKEALQSGVAVITSAHASSLQELKEHPGLSLFFGFFQRFLLLSKRKGPGTIEGIWNRELDLLAGGDESIKAHR